MPLLYIFLVCFLLVEAAICSEDNKIGEGSVVVKGHYPYYTSIQSVDGQHRCGGVVLSEVSILTTCFCVKDYVGKVNDLRVVAGGIYQYPTIPGYQVRKVKKVEHHENCDLSGIYKYDLALLWIRYKFTINNIIGIFPHPFNFLSHRKRQSIANRRTVELFRDMKNKEENCYIVGYDKHYVNTATSHLFQAVVKLVPDKICKETLVKCCLKGFKNFGTMESEGKFCARTVSGIPCNIDVGGPIICSGQVRGLLSRTFKCGEDPAMFQDLFFGNELWKNVGTSSFASQISINFFCAAVCPLILTMQHFTHTKVFSQSTPLFARRL